LWVTFATAQLPVAVVLFDLYVATSERSHLDAV